MIRDYFKKIGILLSNRQTEQFLRYYHLLIEKNQVMNLTAITDFEEVVLKHFIDSVLAASCSVSISGLDFSLDSSCSYSVIDVGTGAGFPGIPLKIVFPELRVVLLDSLNKRVRFLNEVVECLELHNISAVHSRAEDAARNPGYRETFDICVSRAVANLSSLAEYCLPFVRQKGFFLSYKSADVEEECEAAKTAIHLLGGKISQIEKAVLPGTEIERSFVVIRKEKRTSNQYPRKAGIPSKNPLSSR
ncbi:MAG: 16S rRNA (guanine(527)-N(7))-methyltransferase RsmG [Lachnospiraceae bacterium]|nr:16S rRNA (guanine(527)-N(7))-methyltransferase RsmG [Lachnospiraceae bacterium]